MADERGVHIHVGDHVGQDKAGGDQSAVGDVHGQGVAIGRRSSASAGDGGRRRMDDSDLLAAFNELQRQLHQLNTEVTLLKFQVSQLNDRLRTPTPFGPTQWLIVVVVVATAITSAAMMVLQ